MSTLLRRLAGGNLEVVKFGIYLMFPIGWMYYFGLNLEDRFHIKGFWPTAEQSHKIPIDKEEIDAELARMRMVDGIRRERRERDAAAAAAQAQLAQAQQETSSAQ